jgi:hypothetical protein
VTLVRATAQARSRSASAREGCPPVDVEPAGPPVHRLPRTGPRPAHVRPLWVCAIRFADTPHWHRRSTRSHDGFRLYQCADCPDQDPPHEEVRYDGQPTLCLACGAMHSFIDAGPVDVVYARSAT